MLVGTEKTGDVVIEILTSVVGKTRAGLGGGGTVATPLEKLELELEELELELEGLELELEGLKVELEALLDDASFR